YHQVGSFVMIGTKSTSWNHWLEVCVADRAPKFEQRPQSKVVLDLTIKSNKILVQAPDSVEPQIEFKIPRGQYQLYVCGYHLGIKPGPLNRDRPSEPPADRNFEGYRLVFVKSAEKRDSAS